MRKRFWYRNLFFCYHWCTKLLRNIDNHGNLFPDNLWSQSTGAKRYFRSPPPAIEGAATTAVPGHSLSPQPVESAGASAKPKVLFWKSRKRLFQLRHNYAAKPVGLTLRVGLYKCYHYYYVSKNVKQSVTRLIHNYFAPMAYLLTSSSSKYCRKKSTSIADRTAEKHAPKW